jgi:peptidyl-prolyl cis-trans isomerase C
VAADVVCALAADGTIADDKSPGTAAMIRESINRNGRGRMALVAALLIVLSACGSKSTTPVATAPPAVAKVGGQPVSQALFDYYVQKRTGQLPEKIDSGLKQRLLEDLIAIDAAALAEEQSPKPGIEQEVELARLEVLGKAAADTAGVYATPSDQELQSAYQAYVTAQPAQEYHVAHILVATEALAVRVIDDLSHGKDFAALARERSADDSKTRGGDLGWIASGHLPKPFTDSVSSLKPGQYTKHPVQTPYGWHVIKLIESRPAAPPPFEQVKAQLAVNLQQERREKFIQAVLAKTTIERAPPRTSSN